MLPDGTYDAIVVDAEPVGAARLRLELAVLAGEHKGDVVAVHAPLAEGSEHSDGSELLGIPATITVSDGRPHLQMEP